ncbi:MAG: BMP family ABC transporter substrate-binding protein [Gorillibacterium sp.]|nr:BMP family ABC transporter substrate-binding protein [Gorillibacterium sp.]
MKKAFVTLTICIMMLTVVVGCGKKENTASPTAGATTNTGIKAPAGFKVGMVTDAGTIDDKSFNQGTYEGIVKAAADFKFDKKYIKPAGTTEADYLKEIGNLYDAGFKYIVTPGYKFETAIFKAQDKYPEGKFVILDGAPQPGDYNYNVKANTVAIYFAEHESGFLAGVAAALELKEGEAGFIGGMKIPAVQKFNWGFQQGLKYANENFQTKIELKAENVVYQGTFSDSAAGGQLAAQMYKKGVNVIFTAAGGVGVGAINEAKTRASAGEKVWIIGVDTDQYADGIYKDDKSIILTSAVKKIDQATYDMIKADIEGKFPGGQTLTFSAKNDGVGIPVKNPNLSEGTVTKVAEVYAKIKAGELTVAAEKGSLIE